MGFYLRCRRLQSGAAAQADSGGLLTAKITGFAKAFAGGGSHRRNRHQPTFANAAEFFNSLLDPERQADAFASDLAPAGSGRLPPLRDRNRTGF